MTDADISSLTIEEVVELYLDAIRDGECPSMHDYQQRYPHLSEEIAELFPLVSAMEGWKDAETDSHGGRNTLGGVPLKRLGDFRILREIGRGGMGIVYEAIQESLQRVVAIKVLAPAGHPSDRMAQRFIREAQLAANLHHSNIVPVFGVGHENGFHYIVMQRIEGFGLDKVLRGDVDDEAAVSTGTYRKATTNDGEPSNPLCFEHPLTQRLVERVDKSERGDGSTGGLRAAEQAEQSQQTRVIPAKLVARLGIQAAQALQYAHENQTLHRDIKPANLLLDNRGHLWIADFGLARALEHEALSRSGDIVGTLLYLAPERLAGKCDSRSDIYSLGLTLAELLLGRPVLVADDQGSLVEKILRGVSHRSGILGKDTPADLETIVLKAIDVDPTHRYQTAADVLSDLQAFLDDRPISARQPSRLENFQRWCRKNPLVASLSSAIAALLILTTILTSVGLFQQRRMRTRTEATLDTTLSALETIYRRFAGVEAEIADPSASTAMLSDEAAEMLKQLLTVYDELASQGGDTSKLRRESLVAQTRVAEIHMRLGKPHEAAEQFQSVITRWEQYGSGHDELQQPAWQLRKAHALLGWGNATEAMQQFKDAAALRNRALAVLEPLEATSGDDLARGLLARTHYLLGRKPLSKPAISARTPQPLAPPPFERPMRPWEREQPRRRPLRPGFIDVWDSEVVWNATDTDAQTRATHLQQALHWLQQQSAASAKTPSSQFLHALVLSELACLPAVEYDSRSQYISQATTILTGLAETHSEVDEYLFEFARTLWVAAQIRSFVRPESVHERRIQEEAIAGLLEDAATHLRKLHHRQPQIPAYAFLLGQICESLAITKYALAAPVGPGPPDERGREAESLVAEAIELQRLLLERNSGGDSERLWLIRYKITALLLNSGRPGRDDRRPQIQEIRADLQQLVDNADTRDTASELLQELSAVEAILANENQRRSDFGEDLRPFDGRGRGR